MREIKTESCNLGAASFCSRSSEEFNDEVISLILTLPREVTGNELVQLRCAARLRSRQIENDQSVLVAEIEKYEFLSRHESEGNVPNSALIDHRGYLDALGAEDVTSHPKRRQRIHGTIPAEITEELTGRYFTAEAYRVNASYCYITTPKLLPLGTAVRVHLDCDPRGFNFHARVVHTRPDSAMNLALTRMEIKVLLVDDSKLIRMAIAGLLQMDPEMELVGEAADGQTALELTGRVHPDVIVMDIMLPRMNGLQAAKVLQEKWPEIPIILISGMNGEEFKRLSERSGAGAFLPKDALCRELCSQIRRLARAAIRPAVSRAIAKNERFSAAAVGGRE
jgi:CheY-like chemotaxis protein